MSISVVPVAHLGGAERSADLVNTYGSTLIDRERQKAEVRSCRCINCIKIVQPKGQLGALEPPAPWNTARPLLRSPSDLGY